MQHRFTKSLIFNGSLVAAPILLFAGWQGRQSDRPILPDATVGGMASPFSPPPTPLAVRMWRLTVPDLRFGGVSALAFDAGELVGLTDSGVVLRFEPPAAARQAIAVRFHDLPAGPGSGRRKSSRDSESLLRDPLGRGWWVGFETRHSLWLFDRDFTRALGRRWLEVDWSRNKGAEALVADQAGTVFALPESGGEAVAAGGRRGFDVPRGTADAARLGDGRLALLVRRITLRGFVSEVHVSGGGGRASRRIPLPLGPLDNAEGIAAAPLANGGTRLWVVTDDNFKPWMRTLLVALDLQPGG